MRRLRGALSVRAKLLAMVLSPILIALPILIGLLAYWGNTYYDRLLIYKISSDLVIANQYLERVLATIGANAQSFAGSARLAAAREDAAALEKLLAAGRRELGFDFIHVLDRQGRPLASSPEIEKNATHAFWPVVEAALAGKARTAIDVYAADQLAALDARLAERARVSVIATVNAALDAKKEEQRGMVVHAASPVHDENGKVVGAVEAGMLLNRNLAFVDAINDIVYKEGSLPLGSRGTATLFLDDVRIATNVRMFENRRALGTRVSLAVRDHVLGEGKTWLGTAFVVNDWYVSGYEPLYDSFERRIGMLYVGYLETPFRRAKGYALALMMLLFAALSLGATIFFQRWARTIFAPLERMNTAMAAVAAGEAQARVGEIASRDEIGALARHFDRLLDTLQTRSEELQSLNADLDRKVMERTAQLETAQRQLAMSEKLAAIGQLTAGVAHEINNPIAVMQGNLDVMRNELGESLAPVRHELLLLDEQINRIRIIVTKLLQFARPEAFAAEAEDVDVNGVVADCLLLVRHMLSKASVNVVQSLRATRAARFSRNELQQVLINLIVNALHAMPAGGTLSVASGDSEDGGVAVAVADTGVGIKGEDLGRIFDPFFTTRRREGTGLGLSISYALVERYGGRIEVASEPGKGATFTLHLAGAAGS